MIGDEHLQLRAHLGAAVFSLTTLAQDLDAEPQVFDALHGLEDTLRQPLLMIALGHEGAGKSSLLNALFGREFCPAGEKETAKPRLFTFDSETADDEHDGIMESRRPLGFLRDFHVIDTPGSNVMTPEDWSALEQFLPGASVVLVVLSITNPWVTSTWDAVQSLAKRWPQKLVFVIQQADQRATLEIDAVVKHVEQTVREKLGISRPVCAVSAKDALLAKTTGADKARLLAESHIENLEKLINEIIATDEGNLGRLRGACQTADKTLGATGRKAREAILALKKEGDRLTALQQKLEDRKEQSLRQVGGALWTLAQSCETAQKRSEEVLQQQLSLVSTLRFAFRGKDLESGIRDEAETRLRDTLGKQIASAVDLLQGDLKSVWQELYDSLGKSFGHDTLEAPDFARQRENLIKCIEAGLDPQVSKQQLDLEVPRLLRQIASWLRVPLGIAVTTGLAALAALLAHIPIAMALGITAAAIAGVGIVVAGILRNKLLTLFREIMVKKREAMLAPIEDHMRHTIDVFYKEIPTTLEMLQGFCVTQQQIYEPLVSRMQQLDQTFRGIAGGLGKGTGA